MVKQITVVPISNEEEETPKEAEEVAIIDEDTTIESNPIIVDFTNPQIDAKENKPTKETIIKKEIEQIECPDCKKFMSVKSYRYSHAKFCVGKFKDMNEKEKVTTPKIKNDKPNPPMYKANPKMYSEKVEETPTESINQTYNVRMKTLKEQRNQRYTNMMENAF
jgi:hypothetical protein